MIALELAGATLINGLAAWLALRFIGSSTRLRRWRREWRLAAVASFNTLAFLTAFAGLRACAERWDRPTAHAWQQPRRSVQLAPISAAPESRVPVTPMLVAGSSTLPAAAQQTPLEAERQNLYRGYRAGYALATDPRHQGSKRPVAWTLNAIVNIRSKGQGQGFSDGFRQGYIAGLKSQPVNGTNPRSDG